MIFRTPSPAAIRHSVLLPSINVCSSSDYPIQTPSNQPPSQTSLPYLFFIFFLSLLQFHISSWWWCTAPYPHHLTLLISHHFLQYFFNVHSNCYSLHHWKRSIEPPLDGLYGSPTTYKSELQVPSNRLLCRHSRECSWQVLPFLFIILRHQHLVFYLGFVVWSLKVFVLLFVYCSESEAQVSIYHASPNEQFGFCCDIDEQASRQLARMS